MILPEIKHSTLHLIDSHILSNLREFPLHFVLLVLLLLILLLEITLQCPEERGMPRSEVVIQFLLFLLVNNLGLLLGIFLFTTRRRFGAMVIPLLLESLCCEFSAVAIHSEFN